MDHILSIYASVNGHMGCFHILVIVNNAAIKLGLQIFLWHPTFFDTLFSIPFVIYPEVELLDHMVILCLIFLNHHTVIRSGCTISAFPPAVHKCSNFPTSSPTIAFYFFNVAILMGVMLYLIILICLFLMISDVEHLFMCLLAIQIYSWRNIQVLYPFLN